MLYQHPLSPSNNTEELELLTLEANDSPTDSEVGCEDNAVFTVKYVWQCGANEASPLKTCSQTHKENPS